MMPTPSNSSDLTALLAKKDARIADCEAEIRAQALLIEKLKHQIAGHNRYRFGVKSEALDQLNLRLEEAEIAEAAERPLAAPAAPEPKEQPKRRPLPDHLARNETVLEIGDACSACGGKLRRLGEDVAEELEYVPGRFVVNRIVRPRMACSCCDRIRQAPPPSRPIERGRPGPGLLAHVLVNKYADHLPLYRQSQIFGRYGVELERSTLADWVGRSAKLLEPLADAIGRHVLKGQAIFADDTPVKMLAKGAGKTKTARVWTYVRDERPWAGEAPPGAWYQFSVDRKGKRTAGHLASFEGWMHADGYAGFEELYRSGRIKEVACLAHVRRKFVDVHQSQGSTVAGEAMERIAELYRIEKEARGSPPEERRRRRQTEAKPLLDDLEAWLAVQLTRISGKSPLGEAIRYALTRLKRLRPYLDHGFLEADTDVTEQPLFQLSCGFGGFSRQASTIFA